MEQRIVESLLLLVAGMTSVFTALLLLAGMIRLLEWTDRTLNTKRIKKYSEKVETHKVDDELNDEIVAVIAAAVAATLRPPVRIRRIRFLTGGGSDPAWAVTGRLNIMASHAIAKRKSSQ
jgi:sodium pump decarboxylase gamma subunit